MNMYNNNNNNNNNTPPQPSPQQQQQQQQPPPPPPTSSSSSSSSSSHPHHHTSPPSSSSPSSSSSSHPSPPLSSPSFLPSSFSFSPASYFIPSPSPMIDNNNNNNNNNDINNNNNNNNDLTSSSIPNDVPPYTFNNNNNLNNNLNNNILSHEDILSWPILTPPSPASSLVLSPDVWGMFIQDRRHAITPTNSPSSANITPHHHHHHHHHPPHLLDVYIHRALFEGPHTNKDIGYMFTACPSPRIVLQAYQDVDVSISVLRHPVTPGKGRMHADITDISRDADLKIFELPSIDDTAANTTGRQITNPFLLPAVPAAPRCIYFKFRGFNSGRGEHSTLFSLCFTAVPRMSDIQGQGQIHGKEARVGGEEGRGDVSVGREDKQTEVVETYGFRSVTMRASVKAQVNAGTVGQEYTPAKIERFLSTPRGSLSANNYISNNNRNNNNNNNCLSSLSGAPDASTSTPRLSSSPSSSPSPAPAPAPSSSPAPSPAAPMSTPISIPPHTQSTAAPSASYGDHHHNNGGTSSMMVDLLTEIEYMQLCGADNDVRHFWKEYFGGHRWAVSTTEFLRCWSHYSQVQHYADQEELNEKEIEAFKELLWVMGAGPSHGQRGDGRNGGEEHEGMTLAVLSEMLNWFGPFHRSFYKVRKLLRCGGRWFFGRMDYNTIHDLLKDQPQSQSQYQYHHHHHHHQQPGIYGGNRNGTFLITLSVHKRCSFTCAYRTRDAVMIRDNLRNDPVSGKLIYEYEPGRWHSFFDVVEFVAYMRTQGTLLHPCAGSPYAHLAQFGDGKGEETMPIGGDSHGHGSGAPQIQEEEEEVVVEKAKEKYNNNNNNNNNNNKNNNDNNNNNIHQIKVEMLRYLRECRSADLITEDEEDRVAGMVLQAEDPSEPVMVLFNAYRDSQEELVRKIRRLLLR